MKRNNRKPSSFGTIIILLCMALFNLPFNMALVIFAVAAPAVILTIVIYSIAKQKKQEQNRPTDYTIDSAPSQVYDNSEGYEHYSSQESYDKKERYGNQKRLSAWEDYTQINLDDASRRASELKTLLKAGIIDRTEYDERMRTSKNR